MWKCFLFIAALIAAAAGPSITPAAVVVNIGGPFTEEIVGTDKVVTFEVFGTDVDDSNERLNAYTIAINGFGPNFGANGVHFVVPGSNFGAAGKPTGHPYVFKDLDPVPPIENFGSTLTRLQFGATAIGQLDEVNIDNNSHNGFLRVSLVIPAGVAPGVYGVSVDPTALSLAGLGAPIVATPGQPAAFFVDIPEPSAAALLLFPSLALLRRARRPAERIAA
jgi:hypothetical protein